jgi:hypothetical protein
MADGSWAVESYNVFEFAADAVDFSQTVEAVLLVPGPLWEITIGVFVIRQEVFVDALAESEV